MGRKQKLVPCALMIPVSVEMVDILREGGKQTSMLARMKSRQRLVCFCCGARGDAMALENITHRLGGNAMSEIGQRPTLGS